MQRNNPTRLAIPIRTKLTLIIFGFFLFLILLELGLRLGGFVITSLQERRNKISIQQKGAYRIMCLGESTTAGQYSGPLEDILNKRNIGIKFSVIDKGIAATNTSFILDRLESNLDAYHPDMVITMTGINDQGPHMPYEPVSDSNAINFLESFRTYKLTRLLWLHIVNRLKELTFYKLSNYVTQPKRLLRETELQQGYVEAKDDSLSRESLRFKKAISLNPGNPGAYAGLARLYRAQGRLLEAEELFKKAIVLNPGNPEAYAGLVWVYRAKGKPLEAEELFKKAIVLNPGNSAAYIGLAWVYRVEGKLLEAEEPFKKAIALNPGNSAVYADLARLYRAQGRLLESEELFKKAIALNPGKSSSYTGLARLYRVEGKLLEAEEPFKKAISLNPGDHNLYAELEVLYENMGNLELAGEYAKKAKELGLNYYSPLTTSNYHKLKTILDKRGIVYVCVQYPMRSLEPLKKMFKGEERIIFVDNEIVFRRELKNAKYEDYFVDNFGGDFGHCTPKGNRLLAENIANVILKEVFNK